MNKLNENQDDIDLSTLPQIERRQLCESYPDVIVESADMLVLKQCKSGTQAIRRGLEILFDNETLGSNNRESLIAAHPEKIGAQMGIPLNKIHY